MYDQHLKQVKKRSELAYKQSNDGSVVACHFGIEYNSLQLVFAPAHLKKTTWNSKSRALHNLMMS